MKEPAWRAKNLLRVLQCVLRNCGDRDALLKRDASVEGCVVACLRHMDSIHAAFGCTRSSLCYQMLCKLYALLVFCIEFTNATELHLLPSTSRHDSEPGEVDVPFEVPECQELHEGLPLRRCEWNAQWTAMYANRSAIRTYLD